MTRQHAKIWLTLLLALWPASSMAAADPDDRCGGAKLKAAANYGKQLLGCESTAARRDEAVDAACQSKALGKLNTGFDRAEGRGGCATNGDDSAVADGVEAYVAAVVAVITYDDNDDARSCAASKLKSAGKHYGDRTNCYSKAAKRGGALDPACGTKADSTLVSSFNKTESVGGCTIEGDSGDIVALDTIAVRDVVAAVSPLCGDNVTGPTNTCDGTDDVACPGLCESNCTCDVPPACGNGTAEFPEECDDGGNVDSDGCSATCVLENVSARCAGVSSSSGTSVDAELVSDALDQPIYVTSPPLDPQRLFVVERPGRIRIIDLDGDVLQAANYLDIADRVSESSEQGLLSMAFHPDFETNGWFFVYYTDNQGDVRISRFEAADPDDSSVSAGTEKILLDMEQSNANHNGGQVVFGPDGYLYAGRGDGGGGGDPDETGQDDNQLMGKILRIDVDVPAMPYYAVPPTNPNYVDGTDELELIWAKGVRNPWRMSFDSSTGDLLIADVGQGSREEVNFQSSASTGGENYGWDIFEGDTCHEADPAPMCPGPGGFTFPIVQYDHGSGACSISGGYVYRGCGRPDLAGTYFYADYCAGFVKTFEVNGGTPINQDDVTSDLTPGGSGIGSIVSFGQDARGELYIIDLEGVFRIIPGP